MTVLAERKATRIILADSKKRLVCSMSRINPEIEPEGVVLFSEGYTGLRSDGGTVSFMYLETTNLLKETAEAFDTIFGL